VGVDRGAIAIQLGNVGVKNVVSELHSRQVSLLELSMLARSCPNVQLKI